MDPGATAKTILFWTFIILLAVVLWRMMSARPQSPQADQPSYSDFMKQVDRDNVRDVTIYPSPNDYNVEGEWRDPVKSFRVTILKESAADLIKELRDKDVPVNVQEVARADWVNFLMTSAPLVLLVGFWIFVMRRMKAGGTKQ